MNYYSTNKQSPLVDFKEAAIRGQAPDKGLYFPETIPQVGKEMIDGIEKLFRIVSETVNFPIPLVKVSENISSLELFHGPTLAFKDVGARFMSRCLGYFLKGEESPSASLRVTVLVATSGDTYCMVSYKPRPA